MSRPIRPRTSSVRTCSPVLFLPLVAAVALLGTACQDQNSPSPTAADAGVSAQQGGGPETCTEGPACLEVTVLTSDGSTAGDGDYTVTAVNPSNGPVQEDGEPAMAATDDEGIALLDDLAKGEYCVHVRPVELTAATVNFGDPFPDFLVPPPDGELPGIPGDEAAVVTGKGKQEVALTRGTYQQFCLDDPPVKLNNDKPRKLKMQVIEAGRVQFTFFDLSGTPSDAPGWGVVDLSGLNLPWFASAPLASDIKPGVLATAADVDGDEVTLACPPGVPITAESGFIQQGTAELTATEPVDCPSAGETLEVDARLQPLMCKIEEINEEEGDGSKVDFLNPVRHGFQAFTDITRKDDAIAIWYDQRGDGEATLKLRDRVEKTRTLQASYRCVEGEDPECELLETKGDLADDVGVDFFFAELEPRVWRITWSLTSLPTTATSGGETASVEYRIETAGDDAPDPSRETASSGFIKVRVPDDDCGTFTNDDRWWVLN